MTDIVPTMTIETDNGPVVINASDFNPELHKMAGFEEAVTFNREEAVAYLTEKGVEFAKNIGDKKLKVLVEETKAKILAEEAKAAEEAAKNPVV